MTQVLHIIPRCALQQLFEWEPREVSRTPRSRYPSRTAPPPHPTKRSHKNPITLQALLSTADEKKAKPLLQAAGLPRALSLPLSDTARRIAPHRAAVDSNAEEEEEEATAERKDTITARALTT